MLSTAMTIETSENNSFNSKNCLIDDHLSIYSFDALRVLKIMETVGPGHWTQRAQRQTRYESTQIQTSVLFFLFNPASDRTPNVPTDC